ncbi:MAG: winged helix-turn-helix domain-containing protein [Promethearchaeota archaeon]
MKILLNHTEKRIIELLKESPKAFTELKKAGGKDLKSDATLSRNLNRLQDKKLIEKYEPVEKPSQIRHRYRLTEYYYNQLEVDLKKKRLQSWISSKMESQSIFNFLKHFLELEYSILTYSANFKEIILDIYSYIKYFNLNLKQIVKNPKFYIFGILYLILHHPDQKYKDLKKELQLNPFEFQDLFTEFKNNKSLEEFQLKTSNDKDLKFYLILEDPILHNFKEEIETLFPRFLIYWEFPHIKFEENFDFFFNFSHYIFKNGFNKVDSNKHDLINFFTENKICLLIFIREYLLEFLEKLKIDSELEPPFKLLSYEEKSKIRKRILLSSQILPFSEKTSIEDFFYNPGVEKDKKIQLLKEIINKLATDINENRDIENKYKLEKLVYLKTHLLLMLKIFQKIDNKIYDNFRKSKNTIKKFNQIKLSYSFFSDEIFKNIIDLEIGLGNEFDYEKRSFTIRFLFERIDHLVNQYSLSHMDKSIIINKIQEIYDIVSKYFSDKIQKLFLNRKITIYSQNPDIFSDSEINELKNQLKKKKNRSSRNKGRNLSI